MSSNQQSELAPEQPKRVAPLTVLLALIMVFFCAILVFVFVGTKRANPVMLDQQGKPLSQSTQAK
jgi:hypothetical protein